MKKILKYSLLTIFCSIIGVTASQSASGVWDIRSGTLQDHKLGPIGNGSAKIVVHERATEFHELESLNASELTLEQYSLSGTKIGSMSVSSINKIDSYSLERAEIGEMYVESIKKIEEKGFARTGSIGLLSVGTMENIGERAFEHSRINLFSVEQMSAPSKSMFAYAQIKSIDVREMGSLAGAEYAFEHALGLIHLGLSDDISAMHENCFRYLDSSSLENMTIYCQDRAGNQIMKFAEKLDNSGFGKTGDLNKFKTLNIALGASLFDVSAGTAVQHDDWPAYVNGIISGVRKEKCFANITNFNVFLGDLVEEKYLKAEDLATDVKVTGCEVCLYKGSPSVYTGAPKDERSDEGDEYGTGCPWKGMKL